MAQHVCLTTRLEVTASQLAGAYLSSQKLLLVGPSVLSVLPVRTTYKPESTIPNTYCRTPPRALSHTSSRAHCRTLLHTAALSDSRTLPRALPYTTKRTAAHCRRAHCHTLPLVLPHIAALQDSRTIHT